jgi:plastocyanin
VIEDTMTYVTQSISSKVPLVALALIVLHTITACGKAPEASHVNLSSAINVAQKLSLQGKVILSGGKPASMGQMINVGQNPLCAGHGVLTNPNWRVSEDGGLQDVVISVRETVRSMNTANDSPLINQRNCEFQPFMTVVQPGQTVRLHNGDMTFHNIRIVQHQLGSIAAGENLVNLAQPARGDENLHSFDQPGIYRLECDVHRWMRAWVYVHDGVHAVVTSKDGTYLLNQALVDGVYEVSAWHPMFSQKLSQTVTILNGQGRADFSFDLKHSFNL